jgi:hypothetical protein
MAQNDEQQIAQDAKGSQAALSKYLENKYNLKLREDTIISDEPEMAFAFYQGQKLVQSTTLRYTGYRIAKINLDDNNSFEVRYSPSNDTSQFPFGGVDNKQSKLLQGDIATWISKTFPDASKIVVRAGWFYYQGEWMLSDLYDGTDIYSPIPLHSGIFVGFTYSQTIEDSSSFDTVFSEIFTQSSSQSVTVVVDIAYPPANEQDLVDKVGLAHHTWTNSDESQ